MAAQGCPAGHGWTSWALELAIISCWSHKILGTEGGLDIGVLPHTVTLCPSALQVN